MGKQKYQHRIAAWQGGSVLLWGLVGLLILAVLGITASRVAMLDSKIVGNALFDNFTYQGAESALRRSINLSNLTEAAEYTVANQAGKAFGPFADAVAAGQVNSHSTIIMGGDVACPPVLQGIAMSTSMTPKAGGVACRIFTVQAGSELPGTAAYSEHVEGILKFVPAE